MTCGRFESFVCDYLDGTLGFKERRWFEDHAAICATCAERLADAEWTVGFLRDVPAVEPPEYLVTDILEGTAPIGEEVLAPAGSSAGYALGGWLRPLFHPWVEPRFAVSMAMTLLSFSMITYSGERTLRNWQRQGTTPAVVVQQAENHLRSAWARSVEIYESLRASYGGEPPGSGSVPGGAGQRPGNDSASPARAQ